MTATAASTAAAPATVKPIAIASVNASAAVSARLAPPAGVCQRDEAARVRSAVTTLDERSRRVVALRYGIDGEDARTLTEVAGELGVSPQRVRKLEQRSLRALATRPELRALRAA